MSVQATLASITHLVHIAVLQVHEELDGVAALPGLFTATLRVIDAAAPIAAQGHLQELHRVIPAKLLE
jgi:hypothetical protein